MINLFMALIYLNFTTQRDYWIDNYYVYECNKTYGRNECGNIHICID